MSKKTIRGNVLLLLIRNPFQSTCWGRTLEKRTNFQNGTVGTCNERITPVRWWEQSQDQHFCSPHWTISPQHCHNCILKGMQNIFRNLIDMWCEGNLRNNLHSNQVSMNICLTRKCTNIFYILFDLIGLFGVPFEGSGIRSLDFWPQNVNHMNQFFSH